MHTRLLPYSNNSGVASHGILLFSSVVYIDFSASKYIYSSKTVTRSRIRMNEVANLFFFDIKFFTQHHHYCFWQYHVHYVLKCTKLHKERSLKAALNLTVQDLHLEVAIYSLSPSPQRRSIAPSKLAQTAHLLYI